MAASRDFNITLTVGWEGCYRPIEWVPVEINVVNRKLKRRFGGALAVTAQQDGLNELTVISPDFVLTKDYPVYRPMVSKLAFGATTITVDILNNRGQTVWRKPYSLSGSSAVARMQAVDEKDLLIGVAGKPSLTLIRLGKNAVSSYEDADGNVYVKRKFVRHLPVDWTGYASLDALVLCDPEWNKITVEQGRAIHQWVTNGGRLLIVLGTRPLPKEHPIAGLLPFVPGRPAQMEIPLSTLKEWESDPRRSWGGQGRTVSCWSLSGAYRVGWKLNSVGGRAISACGPVAFGKVAVLGFDPRQLLKGPAPTTRSAGPGRIRRPRDPTHDLAKLWTNTLTPLLGTRQIKHQVGGYGVGEDQYYAYELGKVGVGSNAVLGHLLSIPEMRPLSIWWVILLLGALAVLLGPVDYLVLRRLGKLPLTWITSTVWVALFSVGAYYGVQALRAGAMQVRVVSVLDGIKGSDVAWSTHYAGIFAPASAKYRLNGLKKADWWSGIAPTRGEYMYGTSGGLGTRKIKCIQVNRGNRLDSVPINIWSMQTLLNESPLEEKEMPFTANLSVEGGGRLVLKVVNRSDRLIRGGCVRLGLDRTMTFGRVAAKGEGEFSGRAVRSGEWDRCVSQDTSGYIYMGSDEMDFGDFTTDTAYFARGTLRRTRAMQEYLRNGAAVVCVEYDQADVPFGVEGRKCSYNHIQLARMVVFPEKR